MDRLVIETEEDWNRFEEIIRGQVRETFAKHFINSRRKRVPQRDVPGFTSWSSMMARCYNKNHEHYKQYGGRGIKVCRRWHWFKNFFADLGPRPDGLSLERVNVNGNYEPSNCKWATHKEQMRNTRRNKHYELDGEKKTLGEWAKKYGIDYHTVFARIKYGWELREALTTSIYGRWKRRSA